VPDWLVALTGEADWARAGAIPTPANRVIAAVTTDANTVEWSRALPTITVQLAVRDLPAWFCGRYRDLRASLFFGCPRA